MLAVKKLPVEEMTNNRYHRFWNSVAKKVAGEDGCWLWMGRKHRQGYGLFCVKGVEYLASRWAYWFGFKVDPYPLHVCHKCDNPQCCNPKHLFLGTATDNFKDMYAKSRQGIRHKGIQNGNSKLTEDKVIEIRRLNRIGRYGEWTHAKLAERYGISEATVNQIITYATWKHVIDPLVD